MYTLEAILNIKREKTKTSSFDYKIFHCFFFVGEDMKILIRLTCCVEFLAVVSVIITYHSSFI